LFDIDLFRCVEETHLSLQRESFILEAGTSTHGFPVRIALIFERNAFCNLEISIWAHFIPSRPIEVS
jgi:hypothetical protein